MHLFNFTVQPPSAITQAVTGAFTGPKQQEILVAKGKILELLRLDEGGKIQSIFSQEVFGVIRSIMPFKQTGGSGKDYIIVGSDSGRIVILEFDTTKNRFVKLHQETYGKTGCRRIVPGQYLAVDPKGRAAMIGAIEKQKFVYVLNRDSQNRLTISSPLEAHKSHTVLYATVAVDVGFDNPNFACIEVDHSECDNSSSKEAIANVKKMLTFYELDLGLNHVVKKYSSQVDRSAHYLIAVPGGTDGPGGVLVASENFLTYKNINHKDVKVAVPRRGDMPVERGLMIIASSSHKKKNMFFFMVQSEMGDIYKVTLDIDPTQGEVKNINVKYFDTVPVSNSICVMRTGFLFVASEFSDHRVYKFKGLGDEPEDVSAGEIVIEGEEKITLPLFYPRPLKNLLLSHTLESLAPIMDFKVRDLMNEGAPQFYCLCGRGPRSSLRVLRHGLPVTSLAVSPLSNGLPLAVWTVKKSIHDQFDKYIVISMNNMTMVLNIGANVEQVYDSGFTGNVTTLSASLLGEDSLVQVHPNGINHIRAGRVKQWDSQKSTILKTAVNSHQVVIALTGGELVYFELDPITGDLREVDKKDMGQDIACVAIGPVPEGRVRSRYLAVGFYDKTVRILSLDPEDCLNILTRQALPAEPSSLAVAQIGSMSGSQDISSLYLYVGLSNGVLIRSVMDSITGELSDTRTRFLGTKPVKLMKIKVRGSAAVLALSSRSWLCYSFQGKYHMTPLSYPQLEYASSFSSEQCPEGLVSITTTELRVITIDRLGEALNQSIIPLKYTPRKFIIHPQTKKLVIIETDHGTLNPTEKKQVLQKLISEAEGKEDSMDIDSSTTTTSQKKQKETAIPELPENEFGASKHPPNSGKWTSYIRIYDPVRNETTDFLEIPDNEAAFSISLCQFVGKQSDILLAVGCAKDMKLFPRKASGSIHLYKFSPDGKKLQLIHKTPVEDVPYALHPFQGRLLVGMKNILRIYDLGKKKLLRKCENKNFPNFITSIHSQGDRIFVGDITESFHFVKYKKGDNALIIFADDTTPRWLTAAVQLDMDSMAGADKFGNVFVCRLPEDCTEDVEDDYSNNRWLWERGSLNGAPQKANEIVNFYVGEVVTGLVKTNLIAGGPTVLVYSTIMGSIGVMIPFATKEDIEFFGLLEMQLREEHPPLCGRDHLAYRSFYFPVKAVVDGDLCEQFSLLPPEKQNQIAQELERTPNEVMKKIEDLKSTSGF